MADEGGSSSWGLTRKDGVYALALLATFGGDKLIDRTQGANIPVIIERLTGVEKAVAELRDPGGPVLRETAARSKQHDQALDSAFKSIEELKIARFTDLRTSVSREAIDDLKQRLQEARESDRDMRQQLEALRNAMDSLRNEITRVTSSRLIGPAR